MSNIQTSLSGYPPVDYAPISFTVSGISGDSPGNAFYTTLIDSATAKPTNLFCRLSDSLFFYLDKNCPINQNSGFIEAEKLVWHSQTSLGKPMNMNLAPLLDVMWLYYNTCIPYTLNQNREAVLDRRGFLHYLVNEIRENPETAHQNWNQVLNLLKLSDPLTGIPFPTPIPRVVFPASADEQVKKTFEEWAARFVQKIKSQQGSNASVASGQSQLAVQSNVQLSQEDLAQRMRLEQVRHETNMAIINNMGPPVRRYY